ncbi:MAG TPA: terminase, partial [Burkholderiaceae bacterium]
PPLTAEGLWVIEMFAPWLDPQYPKPAKPGELRWVISDDDGNDRWVSGPGEYEVQVAGRPKKVKATSRTYIPASVKDNPYYVASGYEKQLDAMPEPYRSLLMGGFRTAFKDAPDQIIPTKWVQMAQERWKPTPPVGIPMCSMGVDASGGGDDPMIIAPRYDGWYDKIVEVPGHTIPIERAGAYCAGLVVSRRQDTALVVLDMGGGYGGPMYEHLRGNQVEVHRYRGAEATTRRSRDGKLKFVNKRTAALWTFREALDPGQPGGSPIQLPPDPKLVADLTAPTFDVTPNGIRAEAKEKVCERLGRSTDRGDAVVMAWFEGPRLLTDAMEWMHARERAGHRIKPPQVVTSTRAPLSARRRA